MLPSQDSPSKAARYASNFEDSWMEVGQSRAGFHHYIKWKIYKIKEVKIYIRNIIIVNIILKGVNFINIKIKYIKIRMI